MTGQKLRTDSRMLSEAVNPRTLKNLMDALATAHRIGAGIFTPDLKRIVNASNHTPFCQMIRNSQNQGLCVGDRLCQGCDRKHFPEDGKTVGPYRCTAGNWDFAVPIVTSKKILIGAIYGGQVRKRRLNAGDIRGLKKLARECNIDEAELLERAIEIPIMSTTELEHVIHLSGGIAQQIADLVEKRADEHDFLIRLISAKDPQELAPIAVDYAQAILRSGSCSIFLRCQKEGRDVLLLESTSSSFLRENKAVGNRWYEFGEGLTGWVGKTGQHLNISNIHESSTFPDIKPPPKWKGKITETEDPSEITRFLAVPLRGERGDVVRGVLRLIATDTRSPFEDADEATLSSLASLISNALESATIRGNAQRWGDAMSALSQAAAWISSGLDSKQVLKEVIGGVLHVLRLAHPVSVYVLSYDLDKHEFVIVYGGGDQFQEDEIGRTFPDSTGIAGYVVRENKDYYISNDVDKDDYYEPVVGMKSALVVPIRRDSDIMGIISVGSPLLDAFTEEDAKYLKAYSLHVGIALHNAFIHEEVSARLDLQEMSLAALAGGVSVEPVCKEIVRICQNRLLAETCSLFLADGTGRLVLGSSTDNLLEERQRSQGDIWYSIGEGLTGWTATRPAESVVRISCSEDVNELKSLGSDLTWENKHAETLDPAAKRKSFIGVPVYFSDELIGVLRLAQKQRSGSFLPSDEDILKALANQAGICLKFARTLREKDLSLKSFAHDAAGAPVSAILEDSEALCMSEKFHTKKRMDRIYRFARHLGMLMDTYILIGTGQLIKASSPSQVSLHQMVDLIMVHAFAPYGDKKTMCMIENLVDSDLQLTIDKGKLYAILYNLLKNAAAACKSLLRVDCIETEKELKLRITDDGRGIDTTQIPLFVTPGRLGLNIARTFTAILGGSLYFERRDDGSPGTVSIVALPKSSY